MNTTPFFIAGLVLLAGAEAVVLYRKWRGLPEHGRTLSHMTRQWTLVNPKPRRIMIALFLGWLLYHWAFQGF